MRSVLPAILMVCFAGCGATTQDPASALHEYARALQDGRADDAYRLLSDEARRGISVEAFRRMVKDNPDDVHELGRALARTAAPPLVTAKITNQNGQELSLVLEDGKWKVDLTAVDFYTQDTPLHAVQGFVHALSRKRYDIIMRYVPDAHKEGVTPENMKQAWEVSEKANTEQTLAALKQALPQATIEPTGDRASMPYGLGTMQLVREHGLWKIDALK